MGINRRRELKRDIMTGQKKPTEILKEEHENVLHKLDALEEVIGHLDDREAISDKLKELASFFKTDFWIHFAKEEEALFPEIEKFIPRDGGPTGMMLIEHEDLRNTNTEIQQAIDKYLRDADNLETKGMIQRHGTHFIGLLRDHINKEDNILFMMADMHLDQAQMDKVVKLFHEIEKAEG
jgi:hemerythrin-like domain-containing protein